MVIVVRPNGTVPARTLAGVVSFRSERRTVGRGVLDVDGECAEVGCRILGNGGD